MFNIAIPKDFSRADGRPFRKSVEDANGRRVKALDETGKPVVLGKDEAGNPVFEWQTERATYLDMLRVFLNSVFSVASARAQKDKEAKTLGHSDSMLAYDCFRAINVADGVIEMERAPYEWLKAKLEAYGTDIFDGANAAVIYEPVRRAEEKEPTRAEQKRAR